MSSFLAYQAQRSVLEPLHSHYGRAVSWDLFSFIVTSLQRSNKFCVFPDASNLHSEFAIKAMLAYVFKGVPGSQGV